MSTSFVPIEDAKTAGGLRLVLTSGVPGPWGEAAKGLFHAKGIDFLRVEQVGGQPNEELLAWTGHDNAPQAIYQDEPARTGWVEILFLAERLAPQPSLIPDDAAARAWMFGLCRELMGQGGFCWSRRLMLLHPGMQLPEDNPVRVIMARLAGKYGYSPAAAEAAPVRVAAILEMLSQTLAAQRQRGHDCLVGRSVSAADILWASAAAIVSPLPEDLCPMSPLMRAQYATPHADIIAALDPALLDHRDRIYHEHMEVPLRLT